MEVPWKAAGWAFFVITCEFSWLYAYFHKFPLIHLGASEPSSAVRRLITRSVNRIWLGWALLTSSFAQTLHNSHLLPQPFLSPAMKSAA